jgi:hypothetical protein
MSKEKIIVANTVLYTVLINCIKKLKYDFFFYINENGSKEKRGKVCKESQSRD